MFIFYSQFRDESDRNKLRTTIVWALSDKNFAFFSKFISLYLFYIYFLLIISSQVLSGYF
jgi:hypothetical protein